MPVFDFRGTWTALVTPYKEDSAVDFEGLKKNIGFQIDQGVTGVLPVGTTGESPTLATDEHNLVVQKAREYAGKGCDIFAGTGSNSTAEAINHTKHALDTGIDKVLLVDCYYNGPSSLELRREYYQAVLDRFPDVKIVIYVIPGRTGTVIDPVDIAVLSGEYDRVIAIKEATGDLERMKRERALMPDMNIISGDDDKTCRMMTDPMIRAGGVISVTSNLAPGAVVKMVGAALRGDADEAKKLAEELKPLFSIVTVKAESVRILPDGDKTTVQDRFRNPLPVKTAMRALGMPAGPARPPLGKMTREGVDVVRNTLKSVWEESPHVLEPINTFYGTDIEKRLNDDKVWEPLAYEG